MKWALISVWDKRGIVELARALAGHGVGILSSGGTGRLLREAGIGFTEVAAYTGSPEMMDGRVKTLHPRVHGGLLGRRGIDDPAMSEHGIHPIDLLVANLYPFEDMSATISDLAELTEYIDIGGPAMIRAAAKNFRNVAVVTSPADYGQVLDALAAGGFSQEQRFELAKKAFALTAAYDAAISNHFQRIGRDLPEIFSIQVRNGRRLRYGENPHQKGAVFGETGIAAAVPLQGKEMSYNNYLDLHAAAGLIREFDEPATVIVKHNNPCGVAVGNHVLEAYVRARDVDPVSAYGSVVAVNREVGLPLAEEICSTFVEVLAAPSFTPDALEAMERKENMRVLVLPGPVSGPEFRTIDGGLLLQETPPYREHWKVITDRDATPDELTALTLAWKVCKHTRSNTIIFADRQRTLGIGAGQMSRVDAAKIAIDKSLFSLVGSVVASDAFLPFPDTLEIAAAAGATALIQPGGSIRDAEVIAAANTLSMAMIFTGVRYFRH
ncbi:MAG TPA: bifunctional phosphoribosylaminoimidazolecarboxamide formyltransferase/IMP cyclohydrolase [Methanoregulaceae archaeon]|nr:MAG: bifunctional phosphoribosylaminoimidazolecarboxamide formyltransferase/IMP cyclohydrolase [Methanolinea sp.]HON82090.1 bifunctional phosphoribosylaminoimidazolecarboxamide formyltransferase/IMP cyclohydrolase [Methanoregulaceae archaeon]HPD10788.1 bifunctional phosphoribosylaminoimidazolecarboxamide formyltransferase/IMP cyclohydrolase [Methanoregulaceae archaeon]HRT15976.1 bifunctional phosphoribosylaminoimidazolecarboxamide formyltransferase/IMP cyclohydrolase [Methanoregulaceae archae